MPLVANKFVEECLYVLVVRQIVGEEAVGVLDCVVGIHLSDQECDHVDLALAGGKMQWSVPLIVTLVTIDHQLVAK